MEFFIAPLVVALVLIAIAYPIWRPGAVAHSDPIGPAARTVTLEERKTQIYAAIRELGFDYNTDKLLEDDYREEVARLKKDAVAVVRKLAELRSSPPRGPAALEAEIEEAARSLAPGVTHDETKAEAKSDAFCTQCGEGAGAGDRFCSACGAPLRER